MATGNYIAVDSHVSRIVYQILGDLNTLTDVTILNPQVGHGLVWTGSQWVNAYPAVATNIIFDGGTANTAYADALVLDGGVA